MSQFLRLLGGVCVKRRLEFELGPVRYSHLLILND